MGEDAVLYDQYGRIVDPADNSITLYQNEYLTIKGRVYCVDVTVLNAETKIWTENRMNVKNEASGGGGQINTDYNGRVNGHIDPINISNSINVHSIKRNEQHVWIRTQDGREMFFDWIRLPVRAGHTIRFYEVNLDSVQSFVAKLVNLNTGEVEDFSLESYVGSYVFSRIEKILEENPSMVHKKKVFFKGITESFFGGIKKTAQVQRK
ncbi:MAG: hypothetical protein ACYC9S_10185 [Leptospirales bacterium]